MGDVGQEGAVGIWGATLGLGAIGQEGAVGVGPVGQGELWGIRLGELCCFGAPCLLSIVLPRGQGPWPRAGTVCCWCRRVAPGAQTPFLVLQVLIPSNSPASSSARRLGAASALPGPRSHVHLPAGERGGLLRDGGRAGQVSDIPLCSWGGFCGSSPCPSTRTGASPGCCSPRGVPALVASPLSPQWDWGLC